MLCYAQAKKITPSQTLAVGDSGNDLSVLSLDLGLTAAMANASNQIKEVCSKIVPSNNQDGVAFLIEDVLDMNRISMNTEKTFQISYEY